MSKIKKDRGCIKDNFKVFEKKKRVLKQIVVNGKVIVLTDEVKKIFLPSEDVIRKYGLDVGGGLSDKDNKLTKKDRMGKSESTLEGQVGVKDLFSGWDRSVNLKSWDDFVSWHKSKDEKKK